MLGGFATKKNSYIRFHFVPPFIYTDSVYVLESYIFYSSSLQNATLLCESPHHLLASLILFNTAFQLTVIRLCLYMLLIILLRIHAAHNLIKGL